MQKGLIKQVNKNYNMQTATVAEYEEIVSKPGRFKLEVNEKLND